MYFSSASPSVKSHTRPQCLFRWAETRMGIHLFLLTPCSQAKGHKSKSERLKSYMFDHLRMLPSATCSVGISILLKQRKQQLQAEPTKTTGPRSAEAEKGIWSSGSWIWRSHRITVNERREAGPFTKTHISPFLTASINYSIKNIYTNKLHMSKFIVGTILTFKEIKILQSCKH